METLELPGLEATGGDDCEMMGMGEENGEEEKIEHDERVESEEECYVEDFDIDLHPRDIPPSDSKGAQPDVILENLDSDKEDSKPMDSKGTHKD